MRSSGESLIQLLCCVHSCTLMNVQENVLVVLIKDGLSGTCAFLYDVRIPDRRLTAKESAKVASLET